MSSEGGAAWVFGDNIDTDQLAPGSTLKSGIEVVASHCLEYLNPDFAAQVQAGDFVVGGCNFGIGSSREQAAQALCHLGVAAVSLFDNPRARVCFELVLAIEQKLRIMLRRDG